MINVLITTQFEPPRDAEKLKKLVRNTCRRFGLASAQVNIAIVTSRRIRAMNKKFLGHDRSTDCMSFDLTGDDGGPSSAGTRSVLDLVVNRQEAVRQAKLRGHSTEAELALYVVHSLLHQLGFDDKTSGRSALMHRTEDAILAEHGYGRAYNGKEVPAGRRRGEK